MSKIQRYDVNWSNNEIDESENGMWVRYDDILEAEPNEPPKTCYHIADEIGVLVKWLTDKISNQAGEFLRNQAEIDRLTAKLAAYKSRICEAHQPTDMDTARCCPYCMAVKLHTELAAKDAEIERLKALRKGGE